MKNLAEWEKQKEYLVCVDSDGCAMDTMDCKHFYCFGPCMVVEWGLQAWQDEILKRWNDINLYTMTRGINRFKGLAMALTEINSQYCKIDGIDELNAWAANAKELSNPALVAYLPKAKGPCMEKALSWSYQVNKAINALPDEMKKPYAGVLEGLAAANARADVAVVSSANKEAVVEEWERCGLTEHVDVLCCQDSGSKAHCIEVLKSKGYAADHILMVGDAPGDLDAAATNGVYYYPILTRHEEESWSELKAVALEKFLNGAFEAYGESKKQAFLENLGGK